MRTDAARNRARILDAARRLIAAQGPDASMDAIAAAAGVAVGTLYRHHPTKAQLVAAVIEDSIAAFAQVAERSAAAVAAGADPLAELTALITAYADQYAQDRALKAASSVLGVRPPDQVAQFPEESAAHRAGAAVEAVLAAARSSGGVRPDLTLGDLTLLLPAIPDEPAHRARYLDLILGGMARR